MTDAVKRASSSSDTPAALAAIDSFHSSILSEDEVFNTKALIYRGLLLDSSLTSDRRTIAIIYGSFIQRNAATQSYSLCWLLQAKEFLTLVGRFHEKVVLSDSTLLAYESLSSTSRRGA